MPELQDLLSGFGQNQNQLFGGQSLSLSNLLRDRLKGGLPPELRQAQSQAQQGINRSTADALQFSRENRAGSGVSGANTFSDIFRSQGDATANLGANFGQLGLQSQQNNIGNLLGLNQQQIGAQGNVFNQLLGNQQFGRGLDEQGRQFDIGAAFDEKRLTEMIRQFNESQPGLLDIFGNITAGASQALPFALSDRRLKENIHKTGEKTKDGIPIVTYNYKDDPLKVKHTGVIAQDVEKVKPRAVVKAVDYSKV